VFSFCVDCSVCEHTIYLTRRNSEYSKRKNSFLQSHELKYMEGDVMELTKKITTARGTYEIKLIAEEGKRAGWEILEWEVKDVVTKCTLAAGNGMPLLHVPSPFIRLTLVDKVKKIISHVESEEIAKKRKADDIANDIKEFNEWSGVLNA
ncbi:hypothetical protein P5614_018695, partial (plasmid) [Bacillus velezensis]|uniref:hypothetical protein n=2 Tax=Bacillus velezensis TaxID=492670 RepID=UPI003CF7C45E